MNGKKGSKARAQRQSEPGLECAREWTFGLELRQCPGLQTYTARPGSARRRHSPHFPGARVRSCLATSAFGWKGDPQICAILLGKRRPKLGWVDSGYSR
jgi:hypothetical protein